MSPEVGCKWKELKAPAIILFLWVSDTRGKSSLLFQMCFVIPWRLSLFGKGGEKGHICKLKENFGRNNSCILYLIQLQCEFKDQGRSGRKFVTKQLKKLFLQYSCEFLCGISNSGKWLSSSQLVHSQSKIKINSININNHQSQDKSTRKNGFVRSFKATLEQKSLERPRKPVCFT